MNIMYGWSEMGTKDKGSVFFLPMVFACPFLVSFGVGIFCHPSDGDFFVRSSFYGTFVACARHSALRLKMYYKELKNCKVQWISQEDKAEGLHRFDFRQQGSHCSAIDLKSR